jgi:hypothetical protein
MGNDVSLLRSAFTSLRPPRRIHFGSLEEYAQFLASRGVPKPEALALLARAGKSIEAARFARDAEAEKQRQAFAARERRQVGQAAAVEHFWRALGWSEGAPDSSGPVFDSSPFGGELLRRRPGDLDMDGF